MSRSSCLSFVPAQGKNSPFMYFYHGIVLHSSRPNKNPVTSQETVNYNSMPEGLQSTEGTAVSVLITQCFFCLRERGNTNNYFLHLEAIINHKLLKFTEHALSLQHVIKHCLFFFFYLANVWSKWAPVFIWALHSRNIFHFAAGHPAIVTPIRMTTRMFTIRYMFCVTFFPNLHLSLLLLYCGILLLFLLIFPQKYLY